MAETILEIDRLVKKFGDFVAVKEVSARDNLRFFGEMYGLNGSDLTEGVETMLDYVAMTERAKDTIKTYSGGMKRRINLAAGCYQWIDHAADQSGRY
jgi:ABC-type multidrug transport system ATPase subunit